MNNWRNEIPLTFPVIRYHPPYTHVSGAVAYRSDHWVDRPLTIWGSKNGQDMMRHGGRGLSRNWIPPSRSQVLPGGVIDAKGIHVPIVDVDAPDEPVMGLRHILLMLPPIFKTFEYRFSFGEPKQLTLAEYKSKMIELNKKERRMPKTWKKIEKAENFYDAMAADIPLDILKVYHGPVTVKNWIDVPKRRR